MCGKRSWNLEMMLQMAKVENIKISFPCFNILHCSRLPNYPGIIVVAKVVYHQFNFFFKYVYKPGFAILLTHGYP